MKRILLIICIFLLAGCFQVPNFKNQYIPIESSFVVTGSNFQLLGEVTVKKVEPVLFLTSFPITDGLFNEAMKELKRKAYNNYGAANYGKIGLINITMDARSEMPQIPLPFYNYFPWLALIYFQNTITITADVIKYTDSASVIKDTNE